MNPRIVAMACVGATKLGECVPHSDRAHRMPVPVGHGDKPGTPRAAGGAF
jgi:hypothetical protein